MTSQPTDVNREAARKMAIVDAMKPEHRRIVWELGLHNFSRKFPVAYKAAKRRAGIKGSCAFTQTREVAKAASKAAQKGA
jgi:hypothetical protein